jgi:hypothetical protein
MTMLCQILQVFLGEDNMVAKRLAFTPSPTTKAFKMPEGSTPKPSSIGKNRLSPNPTTGANANRTPNARRNPIPKLNRYYKFKSDDAKVPKVTNNTFLYIKRHDIF